MKKLPISFVFMTSTKGHYNFNDIYSTTLNHYEKQLPLDMFATKVAHIKVTPGDGQIGEKIEQDLQKRGFQTIMTIGEWKRGISHQNQYLLDQIKVSKEKSIYNNPHILFVEDDSIILSPNISLENLLSEMVSHLDLEPNILSCRVMRRNDLANIAGKNQKITDSIFQHEHINFQPLIMRSRDFYTMLKIAEDNIVCNIQIEMLWRLLLASYSRSELPHIVFYPDYAETIHLGVPEYLKIKLDMKL